MKPFARPCPESPIPWNETKKKVNQNVSVYQINTEGSSLRKYRSLHIKSIIVSTHC